VQKQDKQTDTFWKLMINNAQELLPYVYTPTVGEACEYYSNLNIQTRGLYIKQEDAGHIKDILKARKEKDIEVIVLTDGERILGLGGKFLWSFTSCNKSPSVFSRMSLKNDLSTFLWQWRLNMKRRQSN
jgi:hypothetical protein